MSQKRLRYTLIGEGFAEYEFIPAYLEWVAGNQSIKMQVSQTKIRLPISKNPSVSKILTEAGTMCAQTFADKKDPCDLCIIGIDLDQPDHTDELDYHKKRIDELTTKMGKVYTVYKDQLIIYVPIQAIDCWISYLQQHVAANSLESIAKETTKKVVYGESKPDRQRIVQVVRAAVANADFNELAKQSRSFRHFHNQVTSFLEAFAASDQ
jgi:hypothetical protein